MSINRRMDKEHVVCVYTTTQPYRNKIVPLEATWTDLEITILGEVKSEKDKCHMISLIYVIIFGTDTDFKNTLMVTKVETCWGSIN